MALLHPPCPRRAETPPFPGFVLSRVSRCGVAQGYASLAPFAAASLDGCFEHPALTATSEAPADCWSATADAFIHAQWALVDYGLCRTAIRA
jgi:hypothetical protein